MGQLASKILDSIMSSADTTMQQPLPLNLPLPGLKWWDLGLGVRMDLSQLDLQKYFVTVKARLYRIAVRSVSFENGSIDQCNLAADLFLKNGEIDVSSNLNSIEFTSCHIGVKMMRVIYRIVLHTTVSKRITVKKCAIDYEGATITDLENMFVEDVLAKNVHYKHLAFSTRESRTVELATAYAQVEENTYSPWPITGAQDADTCLFELVLNVWRRVDALNFMPLRGFALSQKLLKLIRNTVSSMSPTRKVSMAIESWEPEATKDALELIRNEPRLIELTVGTEENPPRLASFPAEFLAEALSSSIYLTKFYMFINLRDPVGIRAILDYVEEFSTKLKYPNRLTTIEFSLSHYASESGYREIGRPTIQDYQIFKEKQRALNQKLAKMQSKKVKMLITLICGSMNKRTKIGKGIVKDNSIWDFFFTPRTNSSLLSLLSRDIFRALSHFL